MLVGELVVVGDHFDESDKSLRFESKHSQDDALDGGRDNIERVHRPLFAFS
jgi:hypothetical protein